MHETEVDKGAFNFSSEKASAPADLQQILEDYESIPFRRREYERQAMLSEIVGRAGYTVNTAATENDSDDLAVIPAEVPPLASTFLPRGEAQQRLQEALLEGDNPVLKALGMGGSGKTVLATILVRDKEVRRHFDAIAWVDIG